jgi:hypothetical protein
VKSRLPLKLRRMFSLVDPQSRQQRNGKKSVQIQCSRILKRVTGEKATRQQRQQL